MKRKVLLIISLVVIILYLTFVSYLWYFFFLDLGSDGSLSKKNNVISNLTFVDENKVYATYGQGVDTNKYAPGYRFRVTNNGTIDSSYRIKLVEIDPTKVNDGCTTNTLLKREELNYLLIMNGETISEGSFDSFENNIIDERQIDVNGDNKYELQIWINSKAVNYQGKHYHYKIEAEVIK